MRLCDAFAGLGADVTIVYPYTYMADNIRKDQIPASYGLKNPMNTRMLWTPLHENAGRLSRFIFMNLAFGRIVLFIFFRNLFKGEDALILSRDTRALTPAILWKKITGRLFRAKIVFMAAEVKDNPRYRFVLKNASGIIAGVSTTRDAIRKMANLPDERFTLSLAPVPEFEDTVSREEARRAIEYHEEKPLVVYTGKLGLEIHEVRYILEAASLLPDYTFLFTGGRPTVVKQVKEYCETRGIKNVLLTGFFNDSTRIRMYQLAADVLVSYYTAKDHMVEFNYPQKINEYLSTGNPVVTPDFPATRDVLNDNNVIFVPPDDPAGLAEGIRRAAEDKNLAERVSRQAKKDIRNLTFGSRAKVWMEFLKQVR